MTAEQLKKVVDYHKRFIDIPSRSSVSCTCDFVEDLLKAELDYLKEYEPRAIVTMREINTAIQVLSSLYHDIEDMDTEELIKAEIWTKD